MAVTQSQLNQLYLAYFGRPVDFDGSVFYTSNPASTEATVSAAFSASPESQALFGAGTVTQQVNSIYLNLFNRDAEIVGLTYWVTQISLGIISAPEAALVILRAAVGTDADAVSNKLAVSQAFFDAIDSGPQAVGYSGTAAAAAARAFIAGVTFEAASLTAAMADVPNAVAEVTGIGNTVVGQTFNLTTGIDTIVGTAGNDTINASDTTATGLDSVDGGEGTDVLNYNDVVGSNDPGPLVSVSGVEQVEVRSVAAAVIDATTWTGVNNLNVLQGTSADVTAADTSAVAISGVAGAVTVDGGSSVAVSSGSSAGVTTAGTSAVTVSGVTGAVTVDGGSSVTISSATANAAVTVGATTVGTGAVEITHTKQGTGAIAVDGGTTVTVNASGVSTGAVSVGQGGVAADLPSGDIAVTSSGAAYVAATTVDTTLGAITIDGGTSVTVNQVAASSTAAAAADLTGATITQSAVAIDGGKNTTSVIVNQSAAATKVDAIAAVAGVKQVDTVTFIALAAGESVTVGGLTFTASVALTASLTAAQVAAAFANLAAGATQGAAPATNGLYSGTFGAYSTGAVVTTGAVITVDATASAALTGVVPIVVSDLAAADIASVNKTAGVTAFTAITGVMGVVGGMVDVDGQITGADVLSTVTLDGYGALSVVKSDALATLNLANSTKDVTITNATATTLALTVNGVGGAVNAGGVYTTVNMAALGANSAVALTAGATKALNVSGDKAVNLTGSALGALETVTVTGSAGLTLPGAAATLKSVNTSGTTGTVVATIDAGLGTYTGGSGVDTVTLATTVNPTKAISLGAGNDSLTLVSGTTTSTSTLSGGDGTDTLVMVAADAATASATATFETKIDGFEKLSLTGAAGETVDLANLDDISYVINAGGTLTLDSMAGGGTLELTAAGVLVNVNLTDATGTADALNVIVKNTAGIAAGEVAAAAVETVNLTVTDTTAASIGTHSLTITDAALKSLVITGNAGLTLTTDSVVLTSVNGSAMTGGLAAATNGTVAQTILGGSGADSLASVGNGDTLNGGAGADTLAITGDLSILVGGAGADVFNVADATTNVNSYATITDLAAGDKIEFSGAAATFAASKVTLADTAVFQDYANAAINLTLAGDVSWFQFAGNTYVVENVSNAAAASFVNGTDIIVKITGAVDLTTASFSSEFDTLLIV